METWISEPLFNGLMYFFAAPLIPISLAIIPLTWWTCLIEGFSYERESISETMGFCLINYPMY